MRYVMSGMAGLRLLIAALVIVGMAQAVQAGDWPMLGHDAAHSGVADEAVEPPLKLLWKYPASSYSPAVSGGIVYVGTASFSTGKGYLLALDATAGSIRWKYEVYMYTKSYPAVSGSTVYIVGTDTWENTEGYGYVYALDANTGSLKWKFRIGKPWYPLTVSSGVVYVRLCQNSLQSSP